jgi:16S rRNA (guanine527-N7)-methyltransferase
MPIKSVATSAVFDRLPNYLAEVGVHASPSQLEQFRAHFDLLMRWNARTNLTSVRDPGGILRRHLAESAYLTRVLPLGPGTLVDIGSGAGFPGIPVKILSPQTKVVLVEAVQKKVAFLKEVARAVGLPGLEVLAGRFEDMKSLAADWVSMRAVKLDARVIEAIRRCVPRGTYAIFLGESDAARLSGAKIHPIVGSDRRVIAVGECSTWNIS